ncbi:hypothetical protein ACDL92_11115 [Ihubacter sp. mB4P-1]|uniref:hypothetical protein n=1 Tax=Ihubacter sp. mB4P-1 TaxID=3242370 RepID=UPI00137A84BE
MFQQIHENYEVISRHFIEDLQCDALLLRHVSGAQLLYLDAPSEEKTFGLGFRLSPEDHTGVAHIIEHCILCGSCGYGVKNWGGEGLIYSFNSAFTMRDSYFIPVSSNNEKAFQELVKLYADGVWNPLAAKQIEPFLQEGWHYEYDAEKDALYYAGVVFSEMQSSYQIPDFLLGQVQVRAACEGSNLTYDVGGDPACIPDLTYEHFLETSKRLFAANNSLGFVYGKTDLHAILEVLDGYLLKAACDEPPCGITGQPKPFSGETYVEKYDVARGNEGKALDILGMNFIIEDSKDSLVTADVLARILQIRLTEKYPELALSVQCQRDAHWPMLNIVVRDNEAKNLEVIKTGVFDEIEHLLAGGLEQELIDAALSASEFSYYDRISFVPVGIDIGIKATVSWVHGFEPWHRLEFKETYQRLHDKANSDFFTKALRKMTVENPFYSQFVMQAEPGLSEKRKAAETEKLRAYKDSLSEEEFAALLAQIESLHEYQKAGDSPQALAKVPVSAVSDFPKEGPVQYVREVSFDRGTLLHHRSDSNLIGMTLHFDISDLSEEEMRDVGAVPIVFGKLGTSENTAVSLKTRSAKNLTHLSAGCQSYHRQEGDSLKLEISLDCLEETFGETVRLLSEMLYDVSFEDGEAIRSLIHSYLSSVPTIIPDPIHRLRGNYLPGEAMISCCSEPEFYLHMQKQLPDGEKLAPLWKKIFAENRLTISLSCSDASLQKVMRLIPWKSTVSGFSYCRANLRKGNAAFQIGGNMQYLAVGFPVDETLSRIAAAGMPLLNQMAGLRLRDLGGAYSVKCAVTYGQDIVLVSNRDPNLKSSLEEMRGVAKYLMEIDEEQRTSAIIQAASKFTTATSISVTGWKGISDYSSSLGNYFRGFTPEKQQEVWQRILHVTREDLQRLFAQIDKALETAACAGAVSGDMLKENQDCFDEVYVF